MHKRKNMRNFLSSERHKCLLLDDRVVKKVSKTNFGGITNKAICWGISAMLGISPMVGIWGVPHAPKSDAAAIRSAALGFAASLCEETISETQAIWGAIPKPQGCLWGAPHAPKAETLRYLGGPKPHIIFFNFLFFNFTLFQCYRTSTGTPRRSSDN